MKIADDQGNNMLRLPERCCELVHHSLTRGIYGEPDLYGYELCIRMIPGARVFHILISTSLVDLLHQLCNDLGFDARTANWLISHARRQPLTPVKPQPSDN